MAVEPELPPPDRPVQWLAWVGLAALVVALLIGLVLQLQLIAVVDRIEEAQVTRTQQIERARQAICNVLTYEVVYSSKAVGRQRLDRQQLGKTIAELDCPPGIVPLPPPPDDP